MTQQKQHRTVALFVTLVGLSASQRQDTLLKSLVSMRHCVVPFLLSDCQYALVPTNTLGHSYRVPILCIQ